MENLIITTPDQLESLIQKAVQRINVPAIVEELSENIGAEEARQELARIWGCPVSESKFYKMTFIRENDMPCRHIGRRLVFDRKELMNWAKDQIKTQKYSVEDAVSQSAKRKF